MSVYLWSDIHIDYGENLDTIESLDQAQYQQDSLILAGDITHSTELLKRCFITFKKTFRYVFFVPGNHDLWLYKDDFSCSISKFQYILELCAEHGIDTAPRLLEHEDKPVWIVPLYSWYCKPEWGEESLFIPKAGEDPTLKMWMDNYRTNWQALDTSDTPDKYFLRLNNVVLHNNYQHAVISFSHFLPNADIIFPDNQVRDYIPPYPADPYPAFNFTRVAGSMALEHQIKRLNPQLHAYGHQHRNKITEVRGINYVSHCMGYPTEDPIGPTGDKRLPLQIWPPQNQD